MSKLSRTNLSRGSESNCDMSIISLDKETSRAPITLLMYATSAVSCLQPAPEVLNVIQLRHHYHNIHSYDLEC